MPLAAVSAYLALRPVVATRWVRGLAAFAWATTGVASASVAQGRLGALVALVLLPPIACGLWLLATRRSTATSAFATALAAAGARRLRPGAAGPGRARWRWCWPWCAVAGAAARPGRRGRAGRRARAVVRAPGRGVVAGARRRCRPGPVGRPDPEALAARPAQPGRRRRPPGLDRRAARRGGRARAAARPRLGQRDDLADPARAGAARARARGARHPAGHRPRRGRGRRRADHALVGPMLLPFALVLVLAVARGLDGVPLRRPRRRRSGAGRRPAHRCHGRGGRGRAVSAAGVAWATLGTELAPWQDPRPAVSVDQAEGAFATRALFVSPGTRGAGYRFVGREASDLVRPLPEVADADGSLADRVSAALGDASTGPTLFADTATDLLAVRSGLVPEVARRLDATDGLQRIAPRDGWDMWRVSPTGTGVDLVAPPRLRLRDPRRLARWSPPPARRAGTRTTVEVPRGSRLVVAEPLGWADHAVVAVDGVTLAPVAGTATPTYALPVGASRLTVTIPDPYRWWHVGQGARLPRARLPRHPLRSPRVPGGSAMSRLVRRGCRHPSWCAAGQRRRASPGWCSWPVPGSPSCTSPRPTRSSVDLVAATGEQQAPLVGTSLATRVALVCPGPGAGRHPRHPRRRGQLVDHGRRRPGRAAARSGAGQRAARRDLRLHRPCSRSTSAPAARPRWSRAARPRRPPASGRSCSPARGRWRPRSRAPRSGGPTARTCAASSPRRAAPAAPTCWLLAGGAGPGRQERLILTNPGANPVTTDVTVHGTAGQLGDPVVETVPPGRPGQRAARRPVRRGGSPRGARALRRRRRAGHAHRHLGRRQQRARRRDDRGRGGPRDRAGACPGSSSTPRAAPRCGWPCRATRTPSCGSACSTATAWCPGPARACSASPAGGGRRAAAHRAARRAPTPSRCAPTCRWSPRRSAGSATGAVPGEIAWSPAATGVGRRWVARPSRRSARVDRTLHLVSTGGNSTAEVTTVVDGAPVTRQVDLLADRVATVPLDDATSVWVRRVTGSGELRGTVVSSSGTGAPPGCSPRCPSARAR